MTKNTSCDTSVLINFLNINRIDLFKRCSYAFFITDHVQDEISNLYPAQQTALDYGLRQKVLQKANVESIQEFDIFANLSQTGQLGAGECAAIAIASHRGYCLAIDDNQVIKKALGLPFPPPILRTQDLILLMIHERLLEIDEADSLIEVWSTQYRFRLKIKSFRELLPLYAE